MSQVITFGNGGVFPPGSVVQRLTADVGFAVPDGANNINIFGVHGINTSGAVSTLDVAINNAITLGDLVPLAPGVAAITLTTGDANIVAGNLRLPDTTLGGTEGTIKFAGTTTLHNFPSGNGNIFLGGGAGNTTLVSGVLDTVVGDLAAPNLTSGSDNSIFGGTSASNLNTGAGNSFFGSNVGGLLSSGNNNISIGANSSSNFAFNESSNIIIGNAGTAADAHTIRIGTQGGGVAQQNKAFMAGIVGVAVANAESVTINSVTGQLGVTGLAANSFVTDSGTATPIGGVLNIIAGNPAHCGSTVKFTGAGNTVELNVADALANTLIGLNAGNGTLTGTNNVALGTNVLFKLTSGSSNSAFGFGALFNVTTGGANFALGTDSLENVTIGNANVGIGVTAMPLLTTGNLNIGIGSNTGWDGLTGLLTGSFNILIGGQDSAVSLIAESAGNNYTGAESSNLILGHNPGVLGENNTMRLGFTGAGDGHQTRCFIAGTDGVNVGSTAKVVTMGTGATAEQLGTATITAGTGVSVTPGANTITIASSGTTTLTYTPTSTTPYVVLTTDQFISVDCSGGIKTVQLPNAPATGRVFTIKDRTGNANINTITVTTVGGVVNIDGAATYLMNTQFAAIDVIFSGSAYEIF